MRRIFTLMLMWVSAVVHADMNKAELIDEVAAAAEVDRAVAERMVDAFTVSITQSLKRNERVDLVGFGAFYVRERAARTSRNPNTGDQIHIPASRIPAFKAGKTLKDVVNEGGGAPSPERADDVSD